MRVKANFTVSGEDGSKQGDVLSMRDSSRQGLKKKRKKKLGAVIRRQKGKENGLSSDFQISSCSFLFFMRQSFPQLPPTAGVAGVGGGESKSNPTHDTSQLPNPWSSSCWGNQIACLIVWSFFGVW